MSGSDMEILYGICIKAYPDRTRALRCVDDNLAIDKRDMENVHNLCMKISDTDTFRNCASAYNLITLDSGKISTNGFESYCWNFRAPRLLVAKIDQRKKFAVPTYTFRQFNKNTPSHASAIDLKKHHYEEYDRRWFWKNLTTYIPHIPFVPPNGREVRILSLGCGKALAAIPLVEYFKRDNHTEGKVRNVSYLGVDISASAISDAKDENKKCTECRFVEADATNFRNFSNPNDRYDVILIRHPGPLKEELWRKIAKGASAHLSKNGFIIVTAYMCYEYRFMEHVFVKELRAKKYLSGSNPLANSAQDSFLAIYGNTKD